MKPATFCITSVEYANSDLLRKRDRRFRSILSSVEVQMLRSEI